MSGHSKWSTIKRAKGAADAKRGALFAKLSKKISLATKEGKSGDPNFNPRLRLEVDKAKQAGMPNDNIERAIKKGMGHDGSASLEEVVYEGYGPGGAAFLIEAITDNKNRTVQSIKTIFTKNNGNLGAQGSVAWQFKKAENGELESSMPLELDDENLAKAEKLYTALEDDDDVTAVYTNIL
jgi:YebC/PmpR family DNA-binding regulatory protein